MRRAKERRIRSYRAAPLPVVMLIVACGSNDSETSADTSPYRSRVDVSKALGALTPDEQVTICQDVASWTNSFTQDPAYISGFCVLSAISNASLTASANHFTVDQMREACRTEEGICRSRQAMGMLPSSRGCAYPATCTATVADLRDCTVGTYQGNVKLYATLPSCDAVQLDTTSTIDFSLATGSVSVCSKVTACGLPS